MEIVPAFIACFMQLMLFWWGHHVWSRRYGLERGRDIVSSLSFVAIVLVYIYPLRVMFGAFFYNASGGSIGSSFVVQPAQTGQMFFIFGVFFALLSRLLVGHFVRALALRDYLGLNALELLETKSDAISWSIVCLTGCLSALAALLLPEQHAPAAAYAYYSLAITMPAAAWWASKRRRALVLAED